MRAPGQSLAAGGALLWCCPMLLAVHPRHDMVVMRRCYSPMRLALHCLCCVTPTNWMCCAKQYTMPVQHAMGAMGEPSACPPRSNAKRIYLLQLRAPHTGGEQIRNAGRWQVSRARANTREKAAHGRLGVSRAQRETRQTVAVSPRQASVVRVQDHTC